MKRFEMLDISGDAGIMAFGRDLKELFENAAAGMYSLITDTESLRETESIDVVVESDSLERLLVAWLNELIFRFDVDSFIAKRVAVTGLSVSSEEVLRGGKTGKPLAVRASLTGEEFDPARHEGKLLLKAATYHNLLIEKKNDIWRGEIIFDI